MFTPRNKKTEPKPQPKKEEPMLPATQQKGQLVDPAMANMLMEDAGSGTEGMKRDDFAIPRINVLQQLSPQINSRDSQHIEGAKAGDIVDTIENAAFSGEEGITVIPVMYMKSYIEWKPRKAGGGLVANHGDNAAILEQCTKDDGGTFVTSKGTEVIPTAEYFCLIFDHQTSMCRPAVISMTKTQLKKAKKWNTVITNFQILKPDGSGMFNPAMFYRAYRLTTIPESNEKGNWFGWQIEPEINTIELPNGPQIYLQARAFKQAILSNEVKVAPPEHDGPTIDPDDIPL